MYNLNLATLQTIHYVSTCYQTDYDEEDKQMHIGEHQDELRYRVVGHNRIEQLALMNPSELILIARHLNPYGVYRVILQYFYVSHHDMRVLLYNKRVDSHIA